MTTPKIHSDPDGEESPQALRETAAPPHAVQFYEADTQILTNNVSRYLCEGLKRGEGLLVIANTEHRVALERRIEAEAGPYAVRRQLVSFDARETLDRFMTGGQPDWERFDSSVGAAVRKLSALMGQAKLRVYGEMVGLLWKAGQHAAAIRLESFWNRLLKPQACHLFCAYPIDIFGEEFQIGALDGILCAHTHLISSGKGGDLENAVHRAMDETLGSKADELRALIGTNYRPSWAAIPKAEATILWIRNNLPGEAGEILRCAREYYRRSRNLALSSGG